MLQAICSSETEQVADTALDEVADNKVWVSAECKRPQ
jgi:hypothetical protein